MKVLIHMPTPIHDALHFGGNYERPVNAVALEQHASDAKTNIAIDHISGMPDIAIKSKIYKAYQDTWWEFEKGEERVDHAARFDDFLRNQKNLTTLVAHDPKTKEAAGILYAYDNPSDHPLDAGNMSRLAGIAVDENRQKQNIGTRLMAEHNAIFKALGREGVVLAYDEPGEKLYKRFSMKPTDEMRVKIKDILPQPHAVDAPSIRSADLREKRDAGTVFAFEKARPQFVQSQKTSDEAAKTWLRQPEHQAWIAENPKTRQTEGAVLSSEWHYPVAQTWVPQYLKMMSIPGVRIGTLDSETTRLRALPDNRQNPVASALLDQALTHARSNNYTNVRIADPGETREAISARGFTQAPVLAVRFPDAQ